MSTDAPEDLRPEAPPPLETLTQLARASFPAFDPGLFHLVSTPPVDRGDGPESRVRKAELRYQTLVERLPVITFLASLDSERSEIYVSPHIEQVLGYTAKEWIENPVLWYQRLHVDDNQRWNVDFTRTVSLGEDFRGDYRFLAKDGHVVWIRGEVTLVRDDHGLPVFLQGLGYDITEMKMAEDVLRRSKEELARLVARRSSALLEANQSLQTEIASRAATEEALRSALKDRADIESALNSHCIVAITDPQGRITYTNEKFCAISQYSRDELLGKDHRIINSGYHSKEFIADLWTTIQSGRTWRGEIRNRAKDGTHYWVDTTIVPFLDCEGQPAQFVAIRTDITERKIAEELAAQRAGEVEAAARVKGEFLANMSHEIRTPMNGIIATAELLSETSLTAGQRDDLDTIVKSGKSLLVVINDILDFTKLESGKVVLEPRAFDLRELTRRVAKLLEPRIAEQGIVYLCVIDESLPGSLVTDETRLGQVLLNVVGNAVKFTPRGGQITVTFRRRGPVGSGLRLACSVSDSGVGIAIDKLQSIFQPFSQADTSTTRLFGGTGLGLSISRALIELLGGELRVESAVGAGTTFLFDIPVEAADNRPPAVLETAALVPPVLNLRSTLRVLVAEDNAVNSMILTRLLQKHGLKPVLAGNGREAVSAYAAAGGANDYDLIFMDVQMPDMDGFQATSLIRDLERTRQRPPCYIVAITAHAMAGDREKCLAAGMDDYMSKPVERKELHRILSRWSL